MKNSKRNNRNVSADSSNVAVLDQPIETVAEVIETEQPTAEVTEMPAPAKNVVGAQPLVRDAMHYGVGTETSFLADALISGKFTKDAIKSAFLAKFCGDDVDQIKRKKTTFSVFFSDVKRPIGTYHASRGLVIKADDNGILSVTPESLAKATAALTNGILPALKGINPKKQPTKYAKVLATFNLNDTESEEEGTEE